MLKTINPLQKTALFLYENKLARTEEKIRKTIRLEALERLPIVFDGTYDKLLSSILNLDKRDILPEERNALYGKAISNDLNTVYPDFFFGGLNQNGSFDIQAFLSHSGIIKRNLGQKIAQASFSNFGEGIVSVEQKLYFPSIAGTVDTVNRVTGMNYQTIK